MTIQREPVASIIIATYNHAQHLSDAIASALGQTVPVEVIVIDDGSTDDTSDVLESWELGSSEESRDGYRFRAIRRPHAGPSAARNFGIEQATAPCVMFLDADDVIAPDKIERQLGVLDSSVGWVLCDVRIEELDGRTTTASKRYNYAEKNLGGWIQPQLKRANFIPIMSPLVRREVLGADVRFSDKELPEDWYFWMAVAERARVRYLPTVAATYRKRKGGRNSTIKPTPPSFSVPAAAAPLRLNLGCGEPGTASWHPVPGLVNLDKSMGWSFEDGLGQFATGSVHGITISHALMYLPEAQWPTFFNELARVLNPGGVVRITEDDATDPRSSRCGGWKGSAPAVTLTDSQMVRGHLESAGFIVHDVLADETVYVDQSLCQAQHGAAPDVFFIEGRRPVGVLFSPHNDDETLFAAYTILRFRPSVVVCFPGTGDYGDPAVRELETLQALWVLGVDGGVTQWAGDIDLRAEMRKIDAAQRPDVVWAPSLETSHPEHLAVAIAARAVFGDRVVGYHTYTKDGAAPPTKVRGLAVPFEPDWPQIKRRALDCYQSQVSHPRAFQFFTWDLDEYVEAK